jgi:hypothetical protein
VAIAAASRCRLAGRGSRVRPRSIALGWARCRPTLGGDRFALLPQCRCGNRCRSPGRIAALANSRRRGCCARWRVPGSLVADQPRGRHRVENPLGRAPGGKHCWRSAAKFPLSTCNLARWSQKLCATRHLPSTGVFRELLTDFFHFWSGTAAGRIPDPDIVSAYSALLEASWRSVPGGRIGQLRARDLSTGDEAAALRFRDGLRTVRKCVIELDGAVRRAPRSLPRSATRRWGFFAATKPWSWLPRIGAIRSRGHQP